MRCPPIDALESAISDASADSDVHAHLRSCQRCTARAELIRQNLALIPQLRGAERAPAPAVLSAFADPAWPGSVSGYELRGEIHRGGQGVVFRAWHEPTRREVALKMLLHGGFATPMQQARFEREVELAAALRHPNVVTIYDSGRTADGRPYLAMELVDGAPLDEFVTGRPIVELLRLFIKICDGVQYAHQRGVIHRDLKPSNILVDAAGEPRILDFGLAKPAAPTDSMTQTQAGDFLGTPLYAAPEQFSRSPDQIDTRTDVYALGVLLYVSLCGQHPHPAGTLLELMRSVAEHDPPPPSRHNPAVSGDLDTLVCTALAKDKARRYQSAAALRDDLTRFLRGEALEAKRDSRAYVLRKSLRRHRVPLGVAAAFAIVLTGTAVKATRDAVRLAKERDEADKARLKAVAAEEAAEDRRREAQENERTAVSALGFVARIFDALQPAVTRGRDTTVLREVLDQTARDLDESNEYADQPRVEATVHNLIAQAYFALGQYPAAERFTRSALATRETVFGHDHPQTRDLRSRLAGILKTRNNVREAEPLFRDVLRGEHTAGEPPSLRYLTALNNLGDLLRELGRFDEAEPLLRESLALRESSPGLDPAELALAENSLAMLHADRGDDAAAELLFWRAYEHYTDAHGDDHPEVARVENNLAAMLTQSGRPEQAEPLFRHALAARRTFFGREHREYTNALNNLATVLSDLDQLDEAEQLYREAAEIFDQIGLGETPNAAATLSNLAGVVSKSRGDEEALPLLERALAIAEACLPPKHYYVAAIRSKFGECLARLGRVSEAEPHLLRAYDALVAARGPADRLTRGACERLATFYESCGLADDAECWRQRSAEAR